LSQQPPLPTLMLITCSSSHICGQRRPAQRSCASQRGGQRTCPPPITKVSRLTARLEVMSTSRCYTATNPTMALQAWTRVGTLLVGRQIHFTPMTVACKRLPIRSRHRYKSGRTEILQPLVEICTFSSGCPCRGLHRSLWISGRSLEAKGHTTPAC